jgi:hypothetical protein
MTPFSEWQTFYEIVGSSAGALIGLQFVVMALIANIPSVRPNEEGGSAFATPNVVHFAAVLLLAGVVAAPWHEETVVAVLLAIIGVAGIVYSLIVTRRMRRQTRYKPEFEDWLCHSILPLTAYTAVSACGWAGLWLLRPALFGIAAATLLLLFTGIHNAWDTATYHVFVQKHKDPNG